MGEFGELGLDVGPKHRVRAPELVDGLLGIELTDVACGSHHTLAVSGCLGFG